MELTLTLEFVSFMANVPVSISVSSLNRQWDYTLTTRTAAFYDGTRADRKGPVSFEFLGGDMNRIRCWAVPVLVVSLWVGAPADAQDMSFDLEESGQGQAPVKLGKPSKLLAEALSAFEAKKYEEAAMKFERVVAGK